MSDEGEALSIPPKKMVGEKPNQTVWELFGWDGIYIFIEPSSFVRSRSASAMDAKLSLITGSARGVS